MTGVWAMELCLHITTLDINARACARAHHTHTHFENVYTCLSHTEPTTAPNSVMSFSPSPVRPPLGASGSWEFGARKNEHLLPSLYKY